VIKVGVDAFGFSNPNINAKRLVCGRVRLYRNRSEANSASEDTSQDIRDLNPWATSARWYSGRYKKAQWLPEFSVALERIEPSTKVRFVSLYREIFKLSKKSAVNSLKNMKWTVNFLFGKTPAIVNSSKSPLFAAKTPCKNRQITIKFALHQFWVVSLGG